MAQGAAVSDEQAKAHIAALLVEREGYERSGKGDRVKQVDAALSAAGHKAQTPAKRAVRL